MAFCVCAGADEGDIAAPAERDDWPIGTAAQAIPVYMGGTILSITETPTSDFIMIGEVSKEEATAYWEEAVEAGFTNIVSKSESAFYDGFTYVANNGQRITLSLT